MDATLRWAPQVGRVCVVAFCIVLSLGACAGSKSSTAVEAGRVTYMTYCVVCHNPNPKLAGGAGPDVAGASRELLEARVLHASYPPGYKPKRATKAMVALPFLAGKIDALAAYLAAAAKDDH